MRLDLCRSQTKLLLNSCVQLIPATKARLPKQIPDRVPEHYRTKDSKVGPGQHLQGHLRSKPGDGTLNTRKKVAQVLFWRQSTTGGERLPDIYQQISPSSSRQAHFQ